MICLFCNRNFRKWKYHSILFAVYVLLMVVTYSFAFHNPRMMQTTSAAKFSLEVKKSKTLFRVKCERRKSIQKSLFYLSTVVMYFVHICLRLRGHLSYLTNKQIIGNHFKGKLAIVLAMKCNIAIFNNNFIFNCNIQKYLIYYALLIIIIYSILIMIYFID